VADKHKHTPLDASNLAVNEGESFMDFLSGTTPVSFSQHTNTSLITDSRTQYPREDVQNSTNLGATILSLQEKVTTSTSKPSDSVIKELTHIVEVVARLMV
jgi:hypothetical protein